MPLIDEQGRLFRRINAIDALVLLGAVALVPLLYGAYVFFRQPEPRILEVQPSKVTPTTTSVTVRGEHLRAFLRVSFNQIQGVSFALVSPTEARVEVPRLPSGTYDVVLYDVAREVHRLPNAVTVEAPAALSSQASLLIAGKFVSIDEAFRPELVKGATLSASGGNDLRIVEIGSARPDVRGVQSGVGEFEVTLQNGQQMPALLQASCTIAERRCQVGGTDVEPGFGLALFTASGRAVRFVVGEAMTNGDTQPVDVRVRLVVPDAAVGLVRTGDRDAGAEFFGQRLATIVSLGTPRSTSASHLWRRGVPWTGAGAGDWSISVNDSAAVVEAQLRMLVDRTSDGLSYRGRQIKGGAPFVFETDRYVARGWVVSVQPSPEAPADR
jgi:hypothetical protein